MCASDWIKKKLKFQKFFLILVPKNFFNLSSKNFFNLSSKKFQIYLQYVKF
jgi:hypothetical protein